jgi:hypothetical protein
MTLRVSKDQRIVEPFAGLKEVIGMVCSEMMDSHVEFKRA